MVNDDELPDALTSLGKSEVRPPSPALVDDLEQRLLDLHGTIDARRGPSVPARLRFTAAVAATAVLVAGFAYVAATRSGEGTTQLSSATDTSVVLPDGAIVAANEGFDLPNGTLVITGPEGSASVDGVTIPQNSQAVIEDGTARLVSSTTTTSAPQPQEPTSTTRPEPVRMELQATQLEARVVGLRWSMYRAPDFKQYSVVRTVRAADGPGDENAVVFTTNDRGS